MISPLVVVLTIASTLYLAIHWARDALGGRLLALIRTLPAGPVLLVTAHPDDESMFFVPIIWALQRAGHPIHCLCLSTGNWEGLGAARTGELQAAGHTLSLASVTVLDRPSYLSDGPRHRWEAPAVEAALHEYLGRPGTPSFKLVLTFDSQGVSGHPNHCDVSRGVRYALGRGMVGAEALLLELQSAAWWQWKYLGPLAMIPALMEAILREGGVEGCIRGVANPHKGHPSTLVAVLSYSEYWQKAVGAMCRHRSQLLWFRYLYLATSSYLHLNTVVIKRLC